MKLRSRKEQTAAVIGGVAALVLAGMGVLVAELWRLQVPRSGDFQREFVQQSVRRIRLPAVRGRIYDRRGTCLADDVPNYCIAVYPEELRAPRSAAANILALVKEIELRVGVPPDISYEDILEHLRTHPREPLTAWKRLDDAAIARWRRAFERWTAPPKGSFRRRRVYGLDLGRPVQGRSIVINTAELLHRRTSTLANTVELIARIERAVGRPPEVNYRGIKRHILTRRALPLLAWTHLDERTMARWADRCSGWLGTGIYCLPDRRYPTGELFAHLIGYTRRTVTAGADSNAAETIHYDLRGLVGVKGLEKTYDKLLGGRPGVKAVLVDVAGFHYSDLQTRPPRPGGDLELSVDANIQRFAAEALALRQPGEETNAPVRGAVVVLDPRNGDVLALVSSPSFDPNRFMHSAAYRVKMKDDRFGRAFNRAVYGQYPPGSTFKPVVALGVLREHPGFARTNYVCNGWIRVNGRKMRCWAWRSGGHGEVSLREALMHSCNVYMFKMALAVGYRPIYEMAREFGLGQYAGLFPELGAPPRQKDIKYGNLPERAVNRIDLCNLSIGQGAITASPLQMAMVAAAIANGGILFRPRLIRRWRTAPDKPWRENPPWAIRRIDLPAQALEIVRGGMYDVVEDPDGTAPAARVDGIEIAGKTGSAQYRARVGDHVETRVYAWMISFAPFAEPRYAVAMLVENGVSGGRTVAPRLGYLYRKIFEYDGTLPRRKEVER